jgi:hypothetical protein
MVTMTKEDTKTVPCDESEQQAEQTQVTESASLSQSHHEEHMDVRPDTIPIMMTQPRGFEEVEEMLPDGTIVKRRLVKAKVRRLVTKKIRRVGADGKVVEDVITEEFPESDITSETSSLRSSLSEARDIVSPVASVPMSPGELVSPAGSTSSRHSLRVYSDTIESEPTIETEVREVEETLPDGRVVRKKIIKTRQKQTVVKRIVMEGPQCSEEEASMVLTGLGPDVQILRESMERDPTRGTVETEERDDIMPDGSTIIRRKTEERELTEEDQFVDASPVFGAADAEPGKIKFKISMEPKSAIVFDDGEAKEQVKKDDGDGVVTSESEVPPSVWKEELSDSALVQQAPAASEKDEKSSPTSDAASDIPDKLDFDDAYAKDDKTEASVIGESVEITAAAVAVEAEDKPEKGLMESMEKEKFDETFVAVLDGDGYESKLHESESKESVEEKSEKESLDDSGADGSVQSSPLGEARHEVVAAEQGSSLVLGRDDTKSVVISVDVSEASSYRQAPIDQVPEVPIVIQQDESEEKGRGEVLVQADGLPGSTSAGAGVLIAPKITYQAASPLVQSPTDEEDQSHSFSQDDLDMDEVSAKLDDQSQGPQHAPVDFPDEADVEVELAQQQPQDEPEKLTEEFDRPLSPSDYTLEADADGRSDIMQQSTDSARLEDDRPPSPSDYTLVSEEAAASGDMPEDVYGVPEPVQPISPMIDEEQEAEEQPGKLDSTSPYLYPSEPYQTLASDEEEQPTDELMPGTNKNC